MNHIKQAGFTALEAILALVVAAVGIGGLTGWVLNIVKLCHSSFQPFTPLVVCRVIGIFLAPLGAVLGFIG